MLLRWRLDSWIKILINYSTSEGTNIHFLKCTWRPLFHLVRLHLTFWTKLHPLCVLLIQYEMKVCESAMQMQIMQYELTLHVFSVHLSRKWWKAATGSVKVICVRLDVLGRLCLLLCALLSRWWWRHGLFLAVVFKGCYSEQHHLLIKINAQVTDRVQIL